MYSTTQTVREYSLHGILSQRQTHAIKCNAGETTLRYQLHDTAKPVGYFIPTQGQVAADLAALRKASKTLDKLLEAQGIEVEAVVTDFKAARKKATQPGRLKTRVP